MYLMKIDPELVSELYQRREDLKKKGLRKPITWQVREAISEYIASNKKKQPFEWYSKVCYNIN